MIEEILKRYQGSAISLEILSILKEDYSNNDQISNEIVKFNMPIEDSKSHDISENSKKVKSS